MNNRYKKGIGIMEHNVNQNLQAVSGNNNLFRQWYHKSTTALGQFGSSHVEIMHNVVEEIDLGTDIEEVVTEKTLRKLSRD